MSLVNSDAFFYCKDAAFQWLYNFLKRNKWNIQEYYSEWRSHLFSFFCLQLSVFVIRCDAALTFLCSEERHWIQSSESQSLCKKKASTSFLPHSMLSDSGFMYCTDTCVLLFP